MSKFCIPLLVNDGHRVIEPACYGNHNRQKKIKVNITTLNIFNK